MHPPGFELGSRRSGAYFLPSGVASDAGPTHCRHAFRNPRLLKNRNTFLFLQYSQSPDISIMHTAGFDPATSGYFSPDALPTELCVRLWFRQVFAMTAKNVVIAAFYSTMDGAGLEPAKYHSTTGLQPVPFAALVTILGLRIFLRCHWTCVIARWHSKLRVFPRLSLL